MQCRVCAVEFSEITPGRKSFCPACARKAKAEVNHKYYLKNKKSRQEYLRAYRERNRSRLLEKAKVNREKPESKSARNCRERMRKVEDPVYKEIVKLRCRVAAHKGNYGKRKPAPLAEQTVGCSLAFLQRHLEASATFRYGSFSSHKDFEVDHIIPLSTATSVEEVRALFHYTNLQYLTPEDNHAKFNKVEKL